MADVTIDAAVSSDLGSRTIRGGIFWTSPTVGYVIYLNATNDLVYKKTADGGANWAAAQVIVAAASCDAYMFDCWADWQTDGDAGTKVHIVYVSKDTDEIRYVYLDTNGDSVGGDDLIETCQGNGTFKSNSNGYVNCVVSITKTRGGNLAVAIKYKDSLNAEFNSFYTSPDADTWTSKASPFDDDTDQCMLFPGNEADNQDVWGAYWDAPGDEILLATFDNSGNSWSKQSVSGSMAEQGAFKQFDGAIRLSDGHLILAAWNVFAGATADLMVWDINGAGSITAKTNVITDTANYVLAAAFINQANDDIYIAYIGGTTVGNLVAAFYQKSDDGAGSWGGQQAMQADAEDDMRGISAGAAKKEWGGKFQPIWFDDDDDDLFTNADNGISIAAEAVPVEQAVGGGSIAIAGSLGRKILVGVGAGAIAIAGTLARLIKIAVGGGSITPVGSLELDYALGIQVDETAVDILKGSLLVDLRIEERSVAEFTIVDLLGTASFLQGQSVIIYDPDNTLIFGGVIGVPETIRTAPSGELLHPIRCIDYHYFADKRLVAESYEDKTCGFIVDDLFDKYLDGEGVTIGLIELGATLVEAIFNYVRVTDAYDALAEKAGKVWFIDENKALYFQDRDTTAAPWTATGDDMAKRSSRLSGGNPLYRNRQYIRGGRGTTAEQTEVIIADGNQFAFTVGFPFERVPTSVNVEDDGAQTIGIKGLDAPGDFDCYWNKGDATITFTAAPIAGKEVTIVYYGQFPILTLVEDTDGIVDQLAIEGVGTGYVDDIADEPTLNDKDASFDSGLAKLARFGVAGKRFIFQTTRSGLKPGQLLPVNYPGLNLDSEDMLIESVLIRSIREHLTYDITAIQGPELGSWTNLFKSLAAMKSEVIERLNVGTEQILIILVKKDETWEWEEEIAVTVLACTACGGVPVGGTTPIVC